MSRVIRINSCSSECPNWGHRGGFRTPAYAPVCNLRNKDLPYTLADSPKGGVVATGTGEIPEWCPLEHASAVEPPTYPVPESATALLEGINAVRMGEEEAKHHGNGSVYWNNAVTACIEAVRQAYKKREEGR